MSANISIKEGGIGRSFNAAKLRTVQPGGGTVDWVPKSDVERSTLYANENGIYQPASEGVYAFDEVRVNVPELDNMTAYGDNWNEYNYKKTDGGAIEAEKVPDYIVVTTLPNKTKYDAGDSIDYAGMVVTAYDRNGNSMGEVPFNELILPAKIAMYDWHGDVIEVGADGLNSPAALCQVIEGSSITVDNWWVDGTSGERYNLGYYITEIEHSERVYAFVCYKNDTNKASMFVSKKPFQITWRRDAPPTWDQHITTQSGTEVIYNGYKAYVTPPVVSALDYLVTVFPISAHQTIGERNAAVLALMGGQIVSMSMQVPVKWPRTGDGKVLETTFEIAVKTPGPTTTT